MIAGIIFILILALIILIKDIAPLKEGKSKKDFLVVSLFALFAISISFMLLFGVKIFNPMQALDSFVKDVLKLSYK